MGAQHSTRLAAGAAAHDRRSATPLSAADRQAASPAISHFLDRLDPDLAASFSAEQLAAIDLHFGMRYRHHHLIDRRIRLPLPFGAGRRHVYLVLLAGTDRTAP